MDFNKYVISIFFLIIACKENNFKEFTFYSKVNKNELILMLIDTSNIESITFHPDLININFITIVMEKPRRTHKIYYGVNYPYAWGFEPFTMHERSDSLKYIKTDEWANTYKIPYKYIKKHNFNGYNYITVHHPSNGLGETYESNFNSDSMKISIRTFFFNENKEYKYFDDNLHFNLVKSIKIKKVN